MPGLPTSHHIHSLDKAEAAEEDAGYGAAENQPGGIQLEAKDENGA